MMEKSRACKGLNISNHLCILFSFFLFFSKKEMLMNEERGESKNYDYLHHHEEIDSK